MLTPRTIESQFRYAAALCKSRMVPKAFDTPEKVLAGLQFAYELGLKPMTALRQIMVLNGTPALFGDLPLSLVRQSGKLRKIREYWYDKNGKELPPMAKPDELFGAYCEVHRWTEEDPVVRVFTLDDAEKARLLGKEGPWKQYPKRMLQCRARAWALKDAFPDVLSGAAIAEYDDGQASEASEGPSGVDKMNQKFSGPSIPAEYKQEK